MDLRFSCSCSKFHMWEYPGEVHQKSSCSPFAQPCTPGPRRPACKGRSHHVAAGQLVPAFDRHQGRPRQGRIILGCKRVRPPCQPPFRVWALYGLLLLLSPWEFITVLDRPDSSIQKKSGNDASRTKGVFMLLYIAIRAGHAGFRFPRALLSRRLPRMVSLICNNFRRAPDNLTETALQVRWCCITFSLLGPSPVYAGHHHTNTSTVPPTNYSG